MWWQRGLSAGRGPSDPLARPPRTGEGGHAAPPLQCRPAFGLERVCRPEQSRELMVCVSALAHTCVLMHVHVRVYWHTCAHAHTCLQVHMDVNTQVPTCIFVCPPVCPCVPAFIGTRAGVYAHVCAHVPSHVHRCAHLHVCTCPM